MVLDIPNSLNVFRHRRPGLTSPFFGFSLASMSSPACFAPFVLRFCSTSLTLPIMASEHANKRPRLDDKDCADPALIRRQRAPFLSSMSRDVSPPSSTRATQDVEVVAALKTQNIGSATSKSPLPQGKDEAVRSIYCSRRFANRRVLIEE